MEYLFRNQNTSFCIYVLELPSLHLQTHIIFLNANKRKAKFYLIENLTKGLQTHELTGAGIR